MEETMAHELLRELGFTIVKNGAGGRYPCGEPGPAPGFRFWVTQVRGRLKLGVQQIPKQELSAELQERLRSQGFLLTPAKTEGFVWLEEGVEASVDAARATLARLRSFF